ncbi:M23 family metallopeptidase [Nitratireductor sp. GISD-1A_MAKvit]|uniref:M23 family metallopeptidase n=1 Tax=Nitratireductor sp. GISD-1A_MAKvit TaxID=3234198 RepID=UPI0034651D11
MMILHRVTGGLACLMALLAFNVAVAHEPDAETLKLGRHYTKVFQQGHAEKIWSDMSETMQSALGDIYHLKGFQASVSVAYGPQREVLEEKTERRDDLRVYRLHAEHERGAELVWQWSFGPDDRIEGFYVQRMPEEAHSQYLDYQTKAELRLPFEGEWHVFWGGRTLRDNYHAEHVAQRFAYDFVVRKSGSTHSGDGTKLEDFYCWDRPVLAPADGKVVSVVDGLPDKEIGEADISRPAGNHVVLELAEGEFAFLAHLRRGSISVAVGDEVTRGDEVGRCGNSGNTSEPHLHMHLQTTPDLMSGEGLPAQFHNYIADGVSKAEGEPVRGEVVSNR